MTEPLEETSKVIPIEVDPIVTRERPKILGIFKDFKQLLGIFGEFLRDI